MSTGPPPTPVIVDHVVTREKLAELLSRQTEYPELDFKAVIDLDSKRDVVELAKDVGAMRVRGGYILAGINDDGSLSGGLDDVDLKRFDEARLVPKLSKYFDEPITLHCNVVEKDEHKVAILCIEASPSGCSFFQTDGTYSVDGKEIAAFRKGDVFWRDGTRSVRIGQSGLDEVIRRRLADEKTHWMDEQYELRRRDRDSLGEAYRTRDLGEQPLGAVTLELHEAELRVAVLELLRRGDDVALKHVWIDGTARALQLVATDDIEDGLGALLDKAACLAATFMTYGQSDSLHQAIAFLVDVYGMPLGEGDARGFGIRSRIGDAEIGPRVWLLILERVTALGGLAVRQQNWEAIRALVLQLPDALAEDGYEVNWRRHALTMASRAQQFEKRGAGEQISLLSLAASVASSLDCMRPDGLQPGDDALLTSLAAFDALACVVAMASALSIERKVYYPNFARYRQHRVQRILDRLVVDQSMRDGLIPGLADDDLAIILAELGRAATNEGLRFDGFDGWEGTAVGAFVVAHLPESYRSSGTV